MIELTEEQKQLKREIIHWYHNFPSGKPYYFYSGAAGTGKTTVMRSVIEDLDLNDDEYIACAYMGKAVMVLLRQGMPASTIHSLIYNPETKAYWETHFDEFGSPHRVKKYKASFGKRSSLPKKLKLIFIDEFPQVNDKIREDLQSYGIPIIAAGDCHQLPPVFGKATGLDCPDFTLTQIMRQSEDNPIVHVAQAILNGQKVPYGKYGNSEVISRMDFDKRILDYDMIICPTNKTRDTWNDRIRTELMGFESDVPQIGDRMICRKNNRDEEMGGLYLTNGMTGYVEDINMCSFHRGIVYIDFRPDFIEGDNFPSVPINYEYLTSSYKKRKEFPWTREDTTNWFEYGYVITVHLSQGSEYGELLFVDEYVPDRTLYKKLRYTAITRARQRFTWVIDENLMNAQPLLSPY